MENSSIMFYLFKIEKICQHFNYLLKIEVSNLRLTHQRWLVSLILMAPKIFLISLLNLAFNENKIVNQNNVIILRTFIIDNIINAIIFASLHLNLDFIKLWYFSDCQYVNCPMLYLTLINYFL